jgi:hypothetical protein
MKLTVGRWRWRRRFWRRIWGNVEDQIERWWSSISQGGKAQNEGKDEDRDKDEEEGEEEEELCNGRKWTSGLYLLYDNYSKML